MENENPPAEEEEPMMDEEEPMMEEKKKSESSESTGDEGCCCQCCDCGSLTVKSKKRVCCCCFPLYLGMIFIILIGIIYCVYVVVDAIFMLLNDYVDDYYAWVILIFLIPLFGAELIMITYLMSDKKKERE